MKQVCYVMKISGCLLLMAWAALESVYAQQDTQFRKNFVLNNRVYLIEVEKKSEFFCQVNIAEVASTEPAGAVAGKPANSQSFGMVFPLEIDPFRNSFFHAVEKLDSAVKREESNEKASGILYEIYKWDFELKADIAPKAGRIIIKNKFVPVVVTSGLYRRKETLKEYWFRIDSIELEIFQGTIRNMLVFGQPGNWQDASKFKTDTLKFLEQKGDKVWVNDPALGYPQYFTNTYPIGISSKMDLTRFEKIQLVPVFAERNKRNKVKKTGDKNESNLKGVMVGNESFKSYPGIKFGEIIEYIPFLAKDADDYSPANGVYSVVVHKDKQPATILYKEKTSQILSTRLYGDFLGISNDQPNSLVQTEVSKKIILIPQTKPSQTLNFIEPSFTLSKFDEKLKEVPVREFSDYSNHLNLLQYSLYNIGFRLNAASLDFPTAKIHINLNYNAWIYRTIINDSTNFALRSQYAVNTFDFQFETNFRFKPDERYGFEFTPSLHMLSPLNLNFRDVSGDFAFQVQLLGYLTTNLKLNNTLFVRYNAYFNGSDMDQNFMQLQLGYSFSLFKKMSAADK